MEKENIIEDENICIICGSADIEENKCKIICKNCGFKRDCTDP